MPSTEPQRDDPPPSNSEYGPDPTSPLEGEVGGGAGELGWLGDIVNGLEDDPRESWLALEALAGVALPVRAALIGELADHRSKPGVRRLLRLLSTSDDGNTRTAARHALEDDREPIPGTIEPTVVDLPDSGLDRPVMAGPVIPWVALAHKGPTLSIASEPIAEKLVRAAVTPVDGQGRGSIVISVRRSGQRRTALFGCDVLRGIVDVIGEVEAEPNAVGRLVDELVPRDEVGGNCHLAGLAIGLLGGSLMLSGPAVSQPVRDWLDGTLGPGFPPLTWPGIIPGWDPSTIAADEISCFAHQVLDACPSWLDRSRLTFDLAEEIHFREGRPSPDPVRDAGAYRYLFEHLLLHRLELYRRMLLWMAWLWQCSGRTERARAAFALASELSDEQYAVPSHPFTVALATRSLRAAQARLRTAEDPREIG